MAEAGKERIIVVADPDLEDLIPGFLENRRKDLLRLMAALAKDEYETVRKLGHSMKGFGKSYGFLEITEIGARLERAALGRAPLEIAQYLEEFADYLERIHVVYQGRETADRT